MPKLLSYWPKEEEINRCIKTEAETASDAVLLSVHQESPLSIRNAGNSSKAAATEDDLLESFLTKDLPEGTLLLAVTGASGAGKSHMIRWLAAHLERDARAENMHVIRVPKSANLRSVVELILEPLDGNDRFANARKELEKAVSSVNPEDGAIHFAANLEVALREEAKTFEGMIREDLDRADIRDLKIKLDHARRLPNYFNDAALRDHFKLKVLPKIVERAIVGKQEDEQEKFPQFSIEDLKLPKDIGLGDAAADVKRYYQTVLNKGENEDGYKKAVEVLNSVVDKAIRNLFHLNQAMGGVTLEAIVLQIRKLLMEEGQELVLLIEDFAALSGIQEVLLSVCIQEAVRDGQLIHSPMRTALAVTDGYLASRDTILTRAKREWIVESSLPNDKEVLTHTERLVGAYLNAARWGEAALIEQFEESRGDKSAGLTDWIKVYRDENESVEEADLLKAFGTINEVPLFPYNAEALQCLIDDHLRVGGKLQFNPRKVINHIIREPLMLRTTFEAQRFPPEAFSQRSARASIASWISSKRLGASTEGRLRQAIIYWGGNPDTADQLGSVEEGIFKAFDLPSPGELGVEPLPLQSPPEPGGEDDGKPTPPTPPPSEPDDFITQWQKRLDSWVDGERLTQKPANEIRAAIVLALDNAVDWNAACMKAVSPKNSLIELPNALGNPSGQKKLVFAQDSTDSDGLLRRTLLAFLRFQHKGGTWNYPEADEDTALIANALEQLIPQYLSLVAKEASEDIAVLATALARQGQILGIAPKRVSGRQSIIEAVFSSKPEVEHVPYAPDPAAEKWHRLKLEAASERQALQEKLASRLGAFQGTGKTVYGIDVARLSLSEADSLAPREDLTAAQRDHLHNLSINRLRARIAPLARELTSSASIFREFLGEEFNKHAVYTKLKDIVDLAEEAKVWPSDFTLEKRAFLNMIEEFREAPVTEIFEKINNFSQSLSKEEFDDTLHILGNIDVNNVNKLRDLMNQFGFFLTQLENEIRSKEEGDKGMSIPNLVSENQNILSELQVIFSLSEGSRGT
jgi:hypothetical protein